MQADQQVVPVLGEPEDGFTLALRWVAHALDLDGIDLAGFGADLVFAQYAEIVGFDLVAIDHLIAHALLAGRDFLLQRQLRSEEHTSELQSLMRISYAVFCLKKKTANINK